MRVTLSNTQRLHIVFAVYRVTLLLANLGWVDFDLGCSTILPSCSAASAKFPPSQAKLGRQWNFQNSSQPNPGSPGDGSPCIMTSDQSNFRSFLPQKCRSRRRSRRAKSASFLSVPPSSPLSHKTITFRRQSTVLLSLGRPRSFGAFHVPFPPSQAVDKWLLAAC